MKKKRRLKKKPIIILIIFLLLIILTVLFVIFKDNFLKKGEKPNTLDKGKSISLSMMVAGNVILDNKITNDGLVKENEYDFDYIFKDLDIIKTKIDLKYYNQESIVGGSSLGISLNNKYNSPIEIVDTMTNLGFNMVSLANLHSFDKGELAIKKSLEHFKSKKILYSGQKIDTKLDSIIKEKNDIKYTMLSYTMDTLVDLPKNNEYLVNKYDKEKVKTDINKIKDSVDLLIVSISWNELKSSDIQLEQTEVVEYLSSLGVDIVIGNGLYSIQPIDRIKNTFVIYSSGNLLSNYSIIDSNISMITTFNIDFKYDGSRINNKKYSNIKSTLLYTTKTDSTNFKVVPYTTLDDNILKNYNDYYEKYANIIKSKTSVVVEK